MILMSDPMCVFVIDGFATGCRVCGNLQYKFFKTHVYKKHEAEFGKK